MGRNSGSVFSYADDAYIGRRVKEARDEFGLTQEKLATAVGVGTKHLNRVENGKKHGSDRLLKKIGRVTGKPLSFFYGDALLPKDASEEEMKILLMFRSATLDQKKTIKMFMQVVLNNKD